MDPQDLQRPYEEPMSRRQFFRERMKTLIPVPSDGPRYMVAMIPIRIFIFILNFVLLALVVFLCTLSKPQLRDSSAVLSAGLSTVYLFFSVLHIIAHFGSTETLEFPMVFGSFIGTLLFTFTGSVIAHAAPTKSWARMFAFLICYFIAVLMACDVLVAIGYWRHKYSTRKKLNPIIANYGDFQSNMTSRTMHPLPPIDVCKCDVQTTMNDGEIIHDSYHNDHVFRAHKPQISMDPRPHSPKKVEMSPYIPCPTKAAFAMMAARGMQTDFGGTQREVQTTRIEVKEIPVQTASKCGLCHRPIDTNLLNHKQYTPPTYDLLASRNPTSPRKSTPVQIPSPLRNPILKCLCKKSPIICVPSTSPNTGSTSHPRYGPCHCSPVTSGIKPTIQQQPQQIPTIEILPACTDAPPEIDSPPYDMNLNIDPGDNKHSQESQRVYETRPTSSRTRPFIGRLAAISGCLTKGSSSSFVVHKNKRTQTKGQNTKRDRRLETEDEFLQNIHNENRELMNEKKPITNEIEVRSINLSSSHKMTPKIESTSKDGIDVKFHEFTRPASKSIVIDRKIHDNEALIAESIGTNEEINAIEELQLTTININKKLNPSKTRTKTLYRQMSSKPVKMEENMNTSFKLESSSDSILKETTLNEPLLNSMTKTNKKCCTNIEPLSPFEKVDFIKLREKDSNKNESQDSKELKFLCTEKTIIDTGKKLKNPIHSGSSLFRPHQSTNKSTSETVSSKNLWTLPCSKVLLTDKLIFKSNEGKEILEQLRPLKQESSNNKDDKEPSGKDNITGSSVRKIICPVCKRAKRPHCVC